MTSRHHFPRTTTTTQTRYNPQPRPHQRQNPKPRPKRSSYPTGPTYYRTRGGTYKSTQAQ
eukprot:4293854-Prorocentrum_lima.AAC.1